jgi:hypothetical protein
MNMNHEVFRGQHDAFLRACSELKKRYDATADWTVVEPVAADTSPGDAALRERVEAARVSAEFSKTPLDVAVVKLQEQAKLPMLIEKQASDRLRVGTDIEVSCQMSDASLTAVLSEMLREAELAWMIDHEVVLITSPEYVEKRQPWVRIYPLRDLIAGPEDRVERLGALKDTIKSKVGLPVWQDAGGEGSITPIYTLDAVVIGASDDVHKRVSNRLKSIRAAQ